MPTSFHGDFYVASATVIPVLFLAYVVQGGTYEAMLEAARDAARATPKRTRDRVAALLLPRAAGAALTAALVGEAAALIGLYQGSDSTGQRLLVLVATLLLMVVVVAAPGWKWLRVRSAINAELLGGAEQAPDRDTARS